MPMTKKERNIKDAKTAAQKKRIQWALDREKLYTEKEHNGDLPQTDREYIDEILKAFAVVELQGINLPKKLSSWIRHRQVVKSSIEKPHDVA